MKTKIINLYGGPGTGKSTSAAYLFYLFKQAGINSEMVREYVKNWAWEGRNVGTYDQFYIVGKQIRTESMLLGKVDYIVTDAPVSLSAFYAKKYSPPAIADAVAATTKAYYQQLWNEGHDIWHVYLQRTKAYNPAGRYQTAEEAKVFDGEIRQFLEGTLHLEFDESSTNEIDLQALWGRITTT